MQETGLSETVRIRAAIDDRVELVKRHYVEGDLSEEEMEDGLEAALEIERCTDAE